MLYSRRFCGPCDIAGQQARFDGVTQSLDHKRMEVPNGPATESTFLLSCIKSLKIAGLQIDQTHCADFRNDVEFYH